MMIDFSKASSRKFIIGCYLEAVATVALFMQMATFDEWFKAALSIGVVYIGGNLIQSYMNKKDNGNTAQ